MADHRVTDLSHGHLGKAIYDRENKSWNFSVDTQHELQIRLVQELKECVALSPIEDEPEEKPIPSVLAQIQMRWLSKSLPEMLPASESISSSLKVSTLDSAFALHEGCLLTAAHAKDIKRISGSNRPLILAFPSGESSHILHLIKLNPETRGWRNRKEAKLKMLDSASIEHGYWTGTGGAILQIASADDEERRMDPWLAVRQDTMITIFQPVYGKATEFTPSSIGNTAVSRLSLQPNPVVSLTPDRTSSRAHVDFSFNPFYPRQFAVVDESGRWSIWNVENPRARGNAHILMPGRSGDISEDHSEPSEGLKGSTNLGHADGWHRVTWTCNVNTIVICSRHRIAVFDVASTAERQYSPDFLPSKGNDWIIDIVRSTTILDHLYVLTTSRIYWIKVIPAGDAEQSIKVLLSYRHFRDAKDETMRLTAVSDGHVSVTITSSQSPLVNVYSFLIDSSSELSCHSSLTLQYPDGYDSTNTYFRDICLLPCAYEPGNPLYGSEGHIQNDENIAFYQFWGLAVSGIFTALCIVQRLDYGEKMDDIQAPDSRTRHAFRSRGSSTIVDDFIVPEISKEPEDSVLARNHIRNSKTTAKDDIRFRVDWSAVYKRAFESYDTFTDIRESIQSVPELLERVNEAIKKGLEEDVLPMDTCANIAQLDKSSGELDDAASALREFISSLNVDTDDPESTSKLVLSDLTHCPGAKDLLGSDSTGVDVFQVHEQLVKYWITSLPLNVSYQSRLAKFKIIRQLGVDLSLNSVGISLQNKASRATNSSTTNPEEEDPLLANDNVATTRESSPGFYSSQPNLDSGLDMFSSLLTPSRTPSMYSHATSAASELKEDSAISRLRQYAVSIKARPDPGKSSLLSHWPSQPGVNPATYSYEAMQKKAAAEDSGNDSEHLNIKEEVRRRKRTERFLRQERERVRATRTRAGSMSQPLVVAFPSGSQPQAYDNGFSSQMVVDELPMTQPVLGTHGSRSITGGKKQKKQRKAGF